MSYRKQSSQNNGCSCKHFGCDTVSGTVSQTYNKTKFWRQNGCKNNPLFWLLCSCSCMYNAPFAGGPSRYGRVDLGVGELAVGAAPLRRAALVGVDGRGGERVLLVPLRDLHPLHPVGVDVTVPGERERERERIIKTKTLNTTAGKGAARCGQCHRPEQARTMAHARWERQTESKPGQK